MSKYKYEEKLEAVLRVKNEGMSYKKSAKILGCGETPVRNWVKRYEKYGEKGLLLKNGTYSGDFKHSVLKYMYENHLSLFETAVIFGIPSDTTVGKWESIYEKEGVTGLYKENRGRRKMKINKIKQKSDQEKTKEEILEEVEYLRIENEYLKKLQALIQEREKKIK